MCTLYHTRNELLRQLFYVKHPTLNGIQKTSIFALSRWRQPFNLRDEPVQMPECPDLCSAEPAGLAEPVADDLRHVRAIHHLVMNPRNIRM